MSKQLEKIKKEAQVTKEILEDFRNIKTEQMAYARDSQKMFEEENNANFYMVIVFQNDDSRDEFAKKFKDFMGLKIEDQVFINGHELAAKLGKPLKTKYHPRTVDLDKRREAKQISETGIIGK